MINRIIFLIALLPYFCKAEAQIYEYYTSGPLSSSPYNIDLVTENFCLGVSCKKKAQETDEELVEYFKLLISQGFGLRMYSPEMSTDDYFVFSQYNGAKYFYTGFSKDFKVKYEWNSARSTRTKYRLIRKVECDISYVTNGAATSGFLHKAYGTHKENETFPNSRHHNTVPSRKQSTRHTCSMCNGKRRIVKDFFQSLYGANDYKVKCNECGGYFMRSTGHTHITCPQCHGKGYFVTD